MQRQVNERPQEQQQQQQQEEVKYKRIYSKKTPKSKKSKDTKSAEVKKEVKVGKPRGRPPKSSLSATTVKDTQKKKDKPNKTVIDRFDKINIKKEIDDSTAVDNFKDKKLSENSVSITKSEKEGDLLVKIKIEKDSNTSLQSEETTPASKGSPPYSLSNKSQSECHIVLPAANQNQQEGRIEDPLEARRSVSKPVLSDMPGRRPPVITQSSHRVALYNKMRELQLQVCSYFIYICLIVNISLAQYLYNFL